mgnify:CR=1 FL=1
MSETTAETAPQRRAGRTRTPKQDPVLTGAVDLAREAVLAPVTDASSVGEHLGVTVHEDRLLTQGDARIRQSAVRDDQIACRPLGRRGFSTTPVGSGVAGEA